VPTNLTAQVSGAQVTLNWTDNSGIETGYEIERALKPKKGTPSFELVGMIAANVTTFVDTPSRGTWLYRVRAIRTGYSPSEYSETVEAVVTTTASVAATGSSSLASSTTSRRATNLVAAGQEALLPRAIDAAFPVLAFPIKEESLTSGARSRKGAVVDRALQDSDLLADNLDCWWFAGIDDGET